MSSQDEPLIEITPEAVSAMKTALAAHNVPNFGLRISIQGGGCSGYTYAMEPEEKARDNDIVIKLDGLDVFVDPMSSLLLKGTNVDYKSTLQSSGFVFNNPNAKRTCGCGSSFG